MVRELFFRDGVMVKSFLLPLMSEEVTVLATRETLRRLP